MLEQPNAGKIAHSHSGMQARQRGRRSETTQMKKKFQDLHVGVNYSRCSHWRFFPLKWRKHFISNKRSALTAVFILQLEFLSRNHSTSSDQPDGRTFMNFPLYYDILFYVSISLRPRSWPFDLTNPSWMPPQSRKLFDTVHFLACWGFMPHLFFFHKSTNM